MLKAMAVGLGYWSLNRTLGPMLAGRDSQVSLRVVTELTDPESEMGQLARIVRSPANWPPTYCDSVNDAVSVLLKESGPVAAFVSLPPGLRDSAVRTLLSAGIPTYLEKPAGLPSTAFPEWLGLARSAGVPFFVGAQRRMEDTYRYLASAVASRDVDDPVRSISCTLRQGQSPVGWRSHLPLAGGGVLSDAGYHLLDASVFLLGGASEEHFREEVVHGTLLGRSSRSSLVEPTLEAEVVGAVAFPGPLSLNLNLSWDAPAGSIVEELEVSRESGETVRLRREQTRRSRSPALITHQHADGTIALLPQSGEPVEMLALPGATSAEGLPIRDFCRFAMDASSWQHAEDHPCSAAGALDTWHLLRALHQSLEMREIHA